MCGDSHVVNSTVAEQTVPLAPKDPLDLPHLIYLPVPQAPKHSCAGSCKTVGCHLHQRLSATDFREIEAMLLKEGVGPPKLVHRHFWERMSSRHLCIF